MDSKKLSSKFHDAVGKEGLSACSKREWDRAIFKQVELILRKDLKILDAGCGYGRIAIPLLNKGYDVYGIDLSKRLIGELKKEHSSKGINHRFKVADMCDLPFKNNTFDVVLCLWSSFDALLFRREQVRALKEMRRILKKDGFAFIEGFTFMKTTQEDIENGNVRGYQNRIRRDYSQHGLEYFHYNHDQESLRKVLMQARISNFTISEEWFGWRERLITRFSK